MRCDAKRCDAAVLMLRESVTVSDNRVLRQTDDVSHRTRLLGAAQLLLSSFDRETPDTNPARKTAVNGAWKTRPDSQRFCDILSQLQSQPTVTDTSAAIQKYKYVTVILPRSMAADSLRAVLAGQSQRRFPPSSFR